MNQVNQGRRKKVPLRTCIVCRETLPKRALTRIVRVENTVIIDSTSKANGRGAYLCGKQTCWEKAANSDLLDRALKTEITQTDRTMIAEYGKKQAVSVE